MNAVRLFYNIINNRITMNQVNHLIYQPAFHKIYSRKYSTEYYKGLVIKANYT